MNGLVFEVSRKWFVSGGHSSKYSVPCPHTSIASTEEVEARESRLEDLLAYLSGLRPAWVMLDPA